MTAIYIDADACPVREEVYRVGTRLNLPVLVVSNGSRPIRPPGLPNVRMVVVDATPDAADDWIADRITQADVCVTADIRWPHVASPNPHGRFHRQVITGRRTTSAMRSPAARSPATCARSASTPAAHLR